jgi:hypothetical protein
MRDTQEELERLEKALLNDETTVIETPPEDLLDPEFLKGVFTEPAFEDPDVIKDPEEPLVYRNFSNAYGTEPTEKPEAPAAGSAKDDRITMGLMITASCLCLGIIGVMVYWLTTFL